MKSRAMWPSVSLRSRLPILILDMGPLTFTAPSRRPSKVENTVERMGEMLARLNLLNRASAKTFWPSGMK